METNFSFGVAAGWARSPERVADLCPTPITHITVGSITTLPREGNIGGTNFYVAPDGTSVNSLGLPNGGAEYWREVLPEMVELAHGADKELVASIAGFDSAEYTGLSLMAMECGVDGIELNFGCPNIWEDEKQKRILSFFPEEAGVVIGEVCGAIAPAIEISAKLSPYRVVAADGEESQRALLEEMARIISGYKHELAAVVTSNTLPNVKLFREDGRPALDVSNNIGGMAGTRLHEIAGENALLFRELLPESIKVIGCGGVQSGRTLHNFLSAGCSGVQIATAFFEHENLGVFSRILEEYVRKYADNFEIA